MYSATRAISGNAFVKALIDLGIIPPHCTRAFIEVKVGSPVKVHASSIADEKQFDTLVDLLLSDRELQDAIKKSV